MQPRTVWIGLVMLAIGAAYLVGIPTGRTVPRDPRLDRPIVKKVARKESKSAALLKKLNQPITLDKGIDANTPLKDALEYFSDRYELTILVNTAAFKEENVKEDIEAVPVKLPKMTGVALATALRLVLAQLPPKGAAYRVRGDFIEITTFKRMRPGHHLKQKVAASFTERPLEEVLQELSDQSGVSVLLDMRAGDRAQTALSATFNNDVSLETAVRLLADMADLKAVVMGNALYVTTKANAKVLETEQAKKPSRFNEAHAEKPARAKEDKGSSKKAVKSR
jgi:hypothetical protein